MVIFVFVFVSATPFYITSLSFIVLTILYSFLVSLAIYVAVLLLPAVFEYLIS